MKATTTNYACNSTFRRVKAWVLKHGCKAKTDRGIVRFAHAGGIFGRSVCHGYLVLKAVEQGKPKPTQHSWERVGYVSPEEWRDSERKRKSAPDIRRARDDKRFRDKLAAKLKRQILACYDPSTIEGLDDWHGTACRVLRKKLTAIAPKSKALVDPFAGRADVIPHDGYEPTGAYKVPIVRRGSDYRASAKLTGGIEREHTPGSTEWRNGRPKSYARATNITYYQSVGLIDQHDNRILLTKIYETETEYLAPEGYRWDLDQQGIRLLDNQTGDDFHFTSDDLLRGVEAMVGVLRQLAETRRQLAAEKLAEEAALSAIGEIFVCRHDSKQAGNCMAGTDNWISSHGLNFQSHVPISMLERMRDDNPRVALVIAVAKRRALREHRNGYCDLAEHGICLQ